MGKAKDVSNDRFYSLKNKRNHEFLKAIIKKMLNCKFISDEDKNQLRIMFNDLDLD